MIDSIKIERFRCFNETELSGFRRLNLFGGKNNAGKTSLLEGIYLGLTSDKMKIRQMRSKYELSDIEEKDKDSNTYLHYGGQTDKPFFISINDPEIPQLIVLEFNKDNTDAIRPNRSSNSSTLITYNEYNNVNTFFKNNRISFILARNGQFPSEYDLSRQFNDADRRGESDEILNSIKLIDNSIDELKTYSDRTDIFLRKKGEKYLLPLPYFGDALQKMMRYAITAATLHSENGSSSRAMSNTLAFRLRLVGRLSDGSGRNTAGLHETCA